MGKLTEGFKPDVSMAIQVIDDTIRVSEMRLHKHDRAIVTMLRRALSLAISIRDQGRLKLVVQSIIDLEDELSKSGAGNDWGFSFENLLLNKKVPLTQEQQEKIVSDLEALFERFVSASNEVGPHLSDAEHAVQLLIQYYRKEDSPEKVRRALILYGEAVVSASENAKGLVGSSLLQKVFELYHNNGMTDEANALTGRMRELGEKSRDEMQTHSQSFEIPKEEIDKWLSAILCGSLKEVLENVVGQFIPDSTRKMAEIRELANVAPFQYLVTQKIQDSNGRTVASIGPLKEDPSGHLVFHISRDMQFHSVFLRLVFQKLVECRVLETESLLEHLLLSAVFDDEQRQILEIGIQSYIDGNYCISAHVLVPQIERALRTLLRLAEGATFKPDRNGGLSLRLLNEILRTEEVAKVLGKDIVLYLQVLLVDQRGWNLRNDICHGIQEPNSFGSAIGDRLIHVLLILAQVHEQKADSV